MNIINKIPNGIRISIVCISLVALGYGLSLSLDGSGDELHPVIKLVEVIKEVPVTKTVEVVKEIEAKLSDAQIKEMYEGRKVAGFRAFRDSSILTPDRKTVSIIVRLDSVGKTVVGESLVRSYIESQLRRNGFTIVDDHSTDNYIIATCNLMLSDNHMQVSGTIGKYCKGEGCWISIENPNGKPVLVETLNKSFIVPYDIDNKKVQVKGKLVRVEPDSKYSFKIMFHKLLQSFLLLY